MRSPERSRTQTLPEEVPKSKNRIRSNYQREKARKSKPQSARSTILAQLPIFDLSIKSIAHPSTKIQFLDTWRTRFPVADLQLSLLMIRRCSLVRSNQSLTDHEWSQARDHENNQPDETSAKNAVGIS